MSYKREFYRRSNWIYIDLQSGLNVTLQLAFLAPRKPMKTPKQGLLPLCFGPMVQKSQEAAILMRPLLPSPILWIFKCCTNTYCLKNDLSKRMWRKYLICFIPTVTPTGPTDVSCGITMTLRTKSFTLKYPNPKITVPDQPKPFLEHTSSQTEGTPLPCMQRFAFHSNLDILPVAPCMRMCLESPISPSYNPAAGNSLPGV